MAGQEFATIARWFQKRQPCDSRVLVPSGDDCAIVTPPTNQSLAITTDSLVAGVHFTEDTNPYALGHKCLAVNLSDLAACGAKPLWVTATLTLPNLDDDWLQAFSAGFFALADRYNVQLIGGDLTQGATRSITVQAIGTVKQPLLRQGAQAGDIIYVSGTLGGAALALQQPNGPNDVLKLLNAPEPQVELGQQLVGIASSAIDISDGLLADLKHILTQSKVGAELNSSAIPIHPFVKAHLSKQAALRLALTGGDDYQLLFTVPQQAKPKLDPLQEKCILTAIGTITNTGSLQLLDKEGREQNIKPDGFQHFRS